MNAAPKRNNNTHWGAPTDTHPQVSICATQPPVGQTRVRDFLFPAATGSAFAARPGGSFTRRQHVNSGRGGFARGQDVFSRRANEHG